MSDVEALFRFKHFFFRVLPHKYTHKLREYKNLIEPNLVVVVVGAVADRHDKFWELTKKINGCSKLN